MSKRILKCFGIFYFISSSLIGQTLNKSLPKDWFLLDPVQDSVQGLSVERAYNTLLKDQPSKPVLVAILDTGIDIDHEDLKDVVWTNPGEIAGNGIDDDKNGYVDDVHGWNFIGGKNGNVKDDTDDLTREYIRLHKKFENANGKVNRKQKDEFEQYEKIKDKYFKLKEKNEQQYNLYAGLYRNMKRSVDTLKYLLKTDSLSIETVKSFQTNTPSLLFAKGFMLNLYRNAGEDADVDEYLKEIKEAVDYYEVIVKYGYNAEFNSRLIVGDNYDDVYEKHYGNNDVKGPDSSHGTHVAGIIGANRKNNLGIKGIADNVIIMPVRMVPASGDERDKDVSNAILYAVNNGAKIINMSFGKKFSPEKEAIDKAVKYAEQKGVLLIHAAGNESDNSDAGKNFPTRYFLNGKEAKNWLEIGASSSGANEEFVANFSNYGKKSVSFFSPGVDIYSTTPGNTYKNESGTSMACPATAGVAALLMSYFPNLSIDAVKNILVNSSRKFDGLKVQRPGDKEMVNFSELSQSGGLINAYEAVKMAKMFKPSVVK